jgi:hypothetical protein
MSGLIKSRRKNGLEHDTSGQLGDSNPYLDHFGIGRRIPDLFWVCTLV